MRTNFLVTVTDGADMYIDFYFLRESLAEVEKHLDYLRKFIDPKCYEYNILCDIDVPRGADDEFAFIDKFYLDGQFDLRYIVKIFNQSLKF